MSPTTISVRGRSTSRHSPERAIVHLAVRFDGSERQKTLDTTLRAAERLREDLEAQHDDATGPVVRWAGESIQVWGERPWNEAGKQLPLVYHATAGFTVEWNDFGAMSDWVAGAAATDGIQLGRIEWRLTEESRRQAEETIRAEAVADALAKARGYATALGLGTVEPSELADVGLLDAHSAPAFVGARMMAMDSSGAAESGPELRLEPEDIEVSAEVEARFIAR